MIRATSPTLKNFWSAGMRGSCADSNPGSAAETIGPLTARAPSSSVCLSGISVGSEVMLSGEAWSFDAISEGERMPLCRGLVKLAVSSNPRDR